MFNPTRLALARRRRRMTARALAEATGINPVTLSRLEAGKHEPEAKTVALLAEKLRFDIGFFMQDSLDELPADAASFRSMSAMTAKERDAALAAGAFGYALLDWVEARFNLPDQQLIDLRHESDPESAALTLRQQWGLGEQPVPNMLRLLESKGVRALSLAENTKTVDAFSCWRNSTPYIFLNTFKSAEHSRFDAAHELGHLVLHKHGGPSGRDAEIEANAFASAFLMPRMDVKSRVPFVGTLDDIVRAKRRWGVSAAALNYRLHKVGVTTEWQNRTFCIQINQRGYRILEPEPMAREESTVWRMILSELWSERVTRAHIARELHLPEDEVESLVFGLLSSPDTIPPPRMLKGAGLKVV